MDILERLHNLLDEKGWTVYRLAKNSGLSQATVTNIFSRNALPTILTLEKMCESFHLSLSQFFAEGEMVELSPKLKDVYECWYKLTEKEKEAIKLLLHTMTQPK